MFYIGLSWVAYWLLITVFNVEATRSALITGIIFVLLGLVLNGPETKLPWNRR